MVVGAGSPFVGMFVADEDGCPTGVNNALKGKHAPTSLKIRNTHNYLLALILYGTQRMNVMRRDNTGIQFDMTH